MWLAIFICWWIGAFISFPLAWMRFTEGKHAKKSKIKQIILILLGGCLSWINVVCELVLLDHELKEEEKQWNK